MSTIEPADTALPNHNNQKKIALINDFTGFGRCSVAVQLPVISQLGVQCCVLPTSVLSNHTGFPSYSFQDFTPYMREHIREWRKLGLKFRGICTGFLGSAEQIAVVSEFIDEFGGHDCIVMVDPVMGDEGHPYGTYTPEMCERMAELTAKADIITPNLTEACILAGVPFSKDMTCEDAAEIAWQLSQTGPARVVVTGVEFQDRVANVCYERGRALRRAALRHRRRVLRHPHRRRGQRRAAGEVGGEGVAFRVHLRRARHRHAPAAHRRPAHRRGATQPALASRTARRPRT